MFLVKQQQRQLRNDLQHFLRGFGFGFRRVSSAISLWNSEVIYITLLSIDLT